MSVDGEHAHLDVLARDDAVSGSELDSARIESGLQIVQLAASAESRQER